MLPKRKTLRLRGYDYSQHGAYFVTICTHNRKQILGQIVVGDGFAVPCALSLSAKGTVVATWIGRIQEKYPSVAVDAWVVMPNHIHLLLFIATPNGTADPSPTIGTADPSPTMAGIPQIMGWFKYQTTKEADCTLWQRSYHDAIIRSDAMYQKIWTYIDQNPLKWAEDCYFQPL